MENNESIMQTHLRTAIYLLDEAKEELLREVHVNPKNEAIGISLCNISAASVLLNEILKNVEVKEDKNGK